MKISVIIIVFLALFSTDVVAQFITSTDAVCSLDGKPSDAFSIKEQCSDPEENNQLRVYFNVIKRITASSTSNFYIKKLSNLDAAYALNVKRNNSSMERWIAINESFYQTKVDKTRQTAMLIWIIGHEFEHHRRGDNLNETKSKLKSFENELRCDEVAGYLVGKIALSTSLKDIEYILNSVLMDVSESSSHPPIKYRIFAAQAGLLRSKAESIPLNQTIEVGRDLVLKSGNGQSFPYTISQVMQDGSSGIIRVEYLTDAFYAGHGRNKWIPDGDGFYITVVDDRPSYLYMGNFNVYEDGFGRGVYDEGEYRGEYKNGKRNGTGIYYNDLDGSIFIGEWKESAKNGKGKLFGPKLLISEGCWVNNRFVGKCQN